MIELSRSAQGATYWKVTVEDDQLDRALEIHRRLEEEFAQPDEALPPVQAHRIPSL